MQEGIGREWMGFQSNSGFFWKKRFGEIKSHDQASKKTKELAAEGERLINRIVSEVVWLLNLTMVPQWTLQYLLILQNLLIILWNGGNCMCSRSKRYCPGPVVSLGPSRRCQTCGDIEREICLKWTIFLKKCPPTSAQKETWSIQLSIWEERAVKKYGPKNSKRRL